MIEIISNKKHLLKDFFHRIDYRFLIILVIGIILRIASIFALDLFFTRFYLNSDAYTYAIGAEGIIKGDYNTHRPPSFPLFVVPFLLIFNDSMIAVRLASFTSGVLLIITSYFVFTKTFLKIFGQNEKEQEKAKYIGLLISLYISIHYPLVYTVGFGRREEFMMVLYILIFYFIFVIEKNESIKVYFIIIVLVSLFTLVHVTAGIFMFLTFLFSFIISKLKFLKISILSNIHMLLISLSFIFSLIFWFIFCFLKFGNPLYTFTMQNRYFQLSSINMLIDVIIDGINRGIIIEIQILFNLIGFVFILFSILIIFIYYKEKQILFLYILLIINFLYLSIFIVASELERLIYYFFPFIYFMGFTFLINIWYEKKDTEIYSFTLLTHKLKITFNQLFALYLLTFIIEQGLYYLYHFVKDAFNFEVYLIIWNLINRNFEVYTYFLSIIGDIILLFISIYRC